MPNIDARLEMPNQAKTNGTQASGAIGLNKPKKGSKNRSNFLEYPTIIPIGIAMNAAKI